MNDKLVMTNQVQNPKVKRNYDLFDRTSKFGSEIIIFVKGIKENNINKSIINQLIRSATSIGANYMEADCAESKKDFIHKIGISKKEAKETITIRAILLKERPNVLGNEIKIAFLISLKLTEKENLGEKPHPVEANA